MQLWRALWPVLGVGTMVFASVTVRVLAERGTALPEPRLESRGRPEVPRAAMDGCPACHPMHPRGS